MIYKTGRLLDLFSIHGELTVKQLSKMTGKSTHRTRILCNDLIARRLIENAGRSKFKLTKQGVLY